MVVLGDPRLEEMQEYKVRMGRWRRETVKSILDPHSVPCLRIVAHAHGPLDHLLHFLQKKLPPDQQDSHLALLVKGKADEIFDEMTALVSDTVWLQDFWVRDLCENNNFLVL